MKDMATLTQNWLRCSAPLPVSVVSTRVDVNDSLDRALVLASLTRFVVDAMTEHSSALFTHSRDEFRGERCRAAHFPDYPRVARAVLVTFMEHWDNFYLASTIRLWHCLELDSIVAARVWVLPR